MRCDLSKSHGPLAWKSLGLIGLTYAACMVDVQAAVLNVCQPPASCTYSTIQSAINAANPSGGDTVQVAAGVYGENVVIDRPLTLQGAQAGVNPANSTRSGGESAISAAYPLTIAASGVVITGFEVRDFHYGVRLTGSYSDAVISYNWIHAPQAGSGKRGVVIEMDVVQHLKITRNRIEAGNTDFNAAIGFSDGGLNPTALNTEVTFNEITNSAYGLFAGASPDKFLLNGFKLNGNWFHSNSGNCNIGNIANGEMKDNLVDETNCTVGMNPGNISGNTFRQGGRLGLWGLDTQNRPTATYPPFRLPSGNLTITHNDFLNEVNGRGVYLLADDSYTNTITLSMNAFRNSGVAPVAMPTYQSPPENCYLSSSTGYLIINYGNCDRFGIPDVRSQSLLSNGNWWGGANGPTDNAGKFFGLVTVNDWITTFTDDPTKMIPPSDWPVSTAGLSKLTGFWPVLPTSALVTGFTQPVDMPEVMNRANAGQNIPLKFRITVGGVGVQVPGLTTSVTVTPLSCKVSARSDDIEEYSKTSGLIYKGDGYYQYNWATPKTLAKTCGQATLGLTASGYSFSPTLKALFMFR